MRRRTRIEPGKNARIALATIAGSTRESVLELRVAEELATLSVTVRGTVRLTTGQRVPLEASVSLDVNGEPRQQSGLDQVIWDVPEILHELSKLYALRAGDLVLLIAYPKATPL